MKKKKESFIDPVTTAMATVTIILAIAAGYLIDRDVKEHRAKIDFLIDSVTRIETRIERLEEKMMVR